MFIACIFVAGFGMASMFVGCDDPNEIINDEPITPTVQTKNIKFNIASMDDLQKKMPEITKAAKNDKDTVTFIMGGNLGFNAGQLQYIKQTFGDLKKRGNFVADWSRKNTNLRSASSESGDYYAYPIGDVFISTFDEYQNDMGGVPLHANPETGETIITTAAAAQQMQETGAVDTESVTTFNQPELYMSTEEDFLHNAAFALALATDDNKKLTVHMNQMIFEQAAMKSDASVKNTKEDIRGIKVSTNRTLQLVQLLRNNKNISLTNTNIIAAKDTVNTTASGLDGLDIYSDGKYNNGKFFRITGQNGGGDAGLRKKFRDAGAYFKTDTLKYGNDGDALSFAIPERLIINNSTGDARGLLKLADYKSDKQIEIESNSGDMLRNHNDSTLAMISTTVAPNTGLFKISFKNPMFGPAYSTEYQRFESGGELGITKMDFNTGNWSGNKLAEAHFGQKLAAYVDTIKINLPTKYVTYDALTAIVADATKFMRLGGTTKSDLEFPVFLLDGAKYSIVSILYNPSSTYQEYTGLTYQMNGVEYSTEFSNFRYGMTVLNKDKMKYYDVRSDSIPMDSIYHSIEPTGLKPTFIRSNTR